MVNNLIGQAVQFDIKGMKGDGIVVGYCPSPEQWEIRYSYEVDEGPYKGKRIASTICACREEMIRVYPVHFRKFRVIWTNCVAYDVYEPSIPVRPGSFYGHSTITHIEVDGKNQVYGQIGFNELPLWIDDLPAMSEQRFAAVKAFHQSHYDRAVNLIYARYWDHLSTTTNQLRIGSGEIEEYFPNRDEAKAWGRSEE
jgi:hypothetical protein